MLLEKLTHCQFTEIKYCSNSPWSNLIGFREVKSYYTFPENTILLITQVIGNKWLMFGQIKIKTLHVA